MPSTGADGDIVRTVLVVPAPVPLLTANRQRSMHFQERSAIVRHWRYATKIYAIAAKIPPYDTVDLDIRVGVGRKKRRRLFDHDAVQPTIKAVIDGMVDAKVIVGDGPKHVLSSTVHAPDWDVQDVVIVTISGPLRPIGAP